MASGRDPITGQRFRLGDVGQVGRIKRPRNTVGRITKSHAGRVEGMDELIRNIRRMSDQGRVQILEKAVDKGAREAQALMAMLAPRSPGGGSRGSGHAADRIGNLPLWSKRDSRARAVGLVRGKKVNWWLKFAELGTVYQGDQSFMRPTAKAMRKRMMQITVRAWAAAVRKGIR